MVGRIIGNTLTFDLRALLTDGDPGNTTLRWGTRSGTTSRYSDPGTGSNTTNNNNGAPASGIHYPIAERPGGVILNGPDLPWSDVTSLVGVRWHPGFGFAYQGFNDFNLTHLDGADAFNFGYAHLRITARAIESSRGVFDLGPGSIAGDFVAACAARGLKAVFTLHLKENTPTPTDIFPDYWATENGGQPIYYLTATQSVARMDLPACIDRVIAIANAMGDAFNGTATVEACIIGLDTAMPNPKPPGWSSANHLAQLQRIPPAIISHYPNLNVFMGVDFMPGSNADALIPVMGANRVGLFAIDVMTGNTIGNSDGMRAFRGLHAADGTPGLTDWRGIVPFIAQVSNADMGGKEVSTDNFWSMQEFRDQARTIGVTHLSAINKLSPITSFAWRELYMDNTGGQVVAPFFTPDVRTWVRDSGPTNPMNTTCPTNYQSCNVT
jgi:hypothetical protein